MWRSRSTISIGRDVGRVMNAGAMPADEDAEVLPFGNVFVNRFVERDAAFLEQHHEGHRGDRLGHGIDTKMVSSLTGTLRSMSAKPCTVVVDDLAAAIDQKLGSRKTAGIDIAPLQMILETVKGGLGHAGGFGRGGGGGEHRE